MTNTVFFQCLYQSTCGRLMLLTRTLELCVTENNSQIEDIRIWAHAHGANPAIRLCEVLQEPGSLGSKFGVEHDTYGLTDYNGMRIHATINRFCALMDASDLVTSLCFIKSPAYMTFVRQTGELGDAALDETKRLAVAGVDKGDILADIHGAFFAAVPATRVISLSLGLVVTRF